MLSAAGIAERLPPGTEPFRAGPQELGEQVRQDHERLGRLVTEMGLQPD